MIKRTLLISTSVAIFCGLSAVQADENRFAPGVGIGTTGISLDAKARLTDRLYARAGYNFLEFDLDDEEYDGVVYDADTDFSTFNAALDYHPFDNSFFVSGGVYAGERTLELVGDLAGPVEIGGQVFTPAQVGSLTGTANIGDDLVPFVGFGFDSRLSVKGPFSYFVQAGVIFTGSPDVSLASVGGTLSGDPLFQAELAAEEQRLQDEVDDYEYYPVLNFGLTYNF